MKVLLVLGLLVAGSASAFPGNPDIAPAESVRACVDQIALQANYEDAVRVRHEVESRARRVSGHTLSIQTLVFDENGDALVRAYTTRCAVADSHETKKFEMHAKVVN